MLEATPATLQPEWSRHNVKLHWILHNVIGQYSSNKRMGVISSELCCSNMPIHTSFRVSVVYKDFPPQSEYDFPESHLYPPWSSKTILAGTSA